MRSPFTADILTRAADDYDARGPVFRLLSASEPENNARSLGLRFLGAVQYLALSGVSRELAAHYQPCGGDGDVDQAWIAICKLIGSHPSKLERRLRRTPQTNEVARSMLLMAAFVRAASIFNLPIRQFEIGSSAGLNLNWDRYRYRGDGWSWGPQNSTVILENRERSGSPLLSNTPITVAERFGCDLHPLDVKRPDDQLELLSFVWADQHERFERLRAALTLAEQYPVSIEQADALSWLRERTPVREGFLTIVFHSVVMEHMSAETVRSIEQAILDIGKSASPSAPYAYVSMELRGKQYETRLTLWPGGRLEVIARSDGHAQSIEWCE